MLSIASKAAGPVCCDTPGNAVTGATLDMEDPFCRIEDPGKRGLPFDFLKEPDVSIHLRDHITHALKVCLTSRSASTICISDQVLDVPACDP